MIEAVLSIRREGGLSVLQILGAKQASPPPPWKRHSWYKFDTDSAASKFRKFGVPGVPLIPDLQEFLIYVNYVIPRDKSLWTETGIASSNM